jgi:hypothetical protein
MRSNRNTAKPRWTTRSICGGGVTDGFVTYGPQSHMGHNGSPYWISRRTITALTLPRFGRRSSGRTHT